MSMDGERGSLRVRAIVSAINHGQFVTLFDRVFQPNALLPSQVPERQEGAYLPARELATAVLISAVRDLQAPAGCAHAERARLWIAGARARLRFDDCCAWLNVDPNWLRERLLSGTTRQLPRHGVAWAVSSDSQESETPESS